MKGAVDLLDRVDPSGRCGEVKRGMRRFLTVSHVVPTWWLARMAADVSPAAGEDGPAAVLGPWADVRPVDPWGRRAYVIALGAVAFACPPDDERTPARAWSGQRAGRARAPLRTSVHAVARSPWWPWRLRAEGSRWRLDPCAGWGDDLVPEGAIDLSHAGGTAGGPAPGRIVLARVVRGPQGSWHAALPLVVPPVDEALLAPAVEAVHAHVGCARPRAEALATGGHLLAGLLHRLSPPP